MTQTREIEKAVCHGCYAVLDAGDSFCRHCGTPLEGGIPTGQPAVEPPPHTPPHSPADPARLPIRWGASPWLALAGLFVLLGPLALPMLWASRRFSRPSKIVLTILVLILTAGVVCSLWYLTYKSLEPLRQLDQLSQL